MSEFLAIVADTWRQSKQQVVFIILAVLIGLATLIFCAYPKIHVDESGEKSFGLQFIDDPVDWPAEGWIEVYAASLVISRDAELSQGDREAGRERFQKQTAAREKAQELAQEIPPLRRSVEFWLYISAYTIFTLGMLLFIGACGTYYPDLLTAGAVDVVLSKPLTRIQVFLGKFFGGLILYGVVITVSHVVIMAVLGMRTGIWHVSFLQVIPLQLFAAAVLYSIIALLGVMFRSTALAVIVGYVFYLVIDSAITAAAQFQRMGVAEDVPLLDLALRVAHYLPSFGYLRDVSVARCLSASPVETMPIAVAGVWMVIALGLGYLKFRRTDF